MTHFASGPVQVKNMAKANGTATQLDLCTHFS